MEMTMRFPSNYNLVAEEEMTYTGGGNAVDTITTVATVIGVCVMAASYIWGVGQSRSWLEKNGQGNIFTILGKATDDLLADMSVSASNAARDAVAAVSMVALWPLSLVLMIIP